MHEMGIASSVMQAARAEEQRRAGARVTKVGLRIGEWAGVDTESLRFCMETLASFAVEIEYQRESLALDIVFLELEESDGTDCGGEESAERERSGGGGVAGALRRARDACAELHQLAGFGARAGAPGQRPPAIAGSSTTVSVAVTGVASSCS